MSSLEANFNELIARIRRGRELGHASFEPIYYLVFDPKEILTVKRTMSAWTSRLKHEGWDVHCFSIAQEIQTFFQDSPLRPLWLLSEKKTSYNYEDVNKSLANALRNGEVLKQKLEIFLSSLDDTTKSIVLVTDLEALHPYVRISAIETQLQGKFDIPTVFLYPGRRTGKTNLSFLGFYRDDGNYRSVHIGG